MVNQSIEIIGWESSGVVNINLGPLLQFQMRIAKLKSAQNSLIIGPRGLGWKINLYKIMVSQSFGVAIFEHGPLLQCQTRVAKRKSA